MNEVLITEIQDGVAYLTINRPEVRNALNNALIEELLSGINSLAKRPSAEVGAVIIQGAGDSAFCAGADLKEIASRPSPADRQGFFRRLAELISAMGRCPKPIIAKVQGCALAGGCGLAAACDLTIASEQAIFGLPEIAAGLVPMVVMPPLSRCIGKKQLSYLILTGEPIDAKRALEIGLVSRVVPGSELDETVRTVAIKLANQGPSAMTLAKEAIGRVYEEEYFGLLPQFADRGALLSLMK